MSQAIISVQNLTRKFGKLIAVDRVNFDVRQGEIFGFLGPNGAGKTTTVRMLTGVIDPSSGTATIQNHDIRKEKLRSRAHIATVPEEANVYSDLSVWQNIMLMGELHGIRRNQRIRTGKKLLNDLGLAERQKQKARTLSKGLRQRLMLCAALITNPDILFLDEPTSGLDVQSARLIRKIVTDLNKKGLTVFLTTHNMSEARELCTRIAIINQGRIAAIDTPDQLRSTISSRQYVEIRFTQKSPDPEILGSLPSVSQLEHANHVFRLYTEQPGKVVKEIVRLSEKEGFEIMHLSTRKPTLEDVFLYFTEGKKEGLV